MTLVCLPGYERALTRLRSLQRFGVRLGLERMHAILARLGDPHRGYPAVHVAGTNGKGSTSAMIAACLHAAGLRVGLYTSPHLCRFTERIRIDDQEIEQGEVERLVDRVLDLEPALTFFEAATAAGLLHFAEQRVDLAVVETGLGGRLDATNVLSPRVTVLTRIDLDHLELLGPDLQAVAREKAGIIKPGVVAISAPSPEEVLGVLRSHAERMDAPLRILGRDFRLEPTAAGLHFQSDGWSLGSLRLALSGDHQVENAALSLAAIHELRRQGMVIPDPAIEQGLASVRWPGRLEWVEGHLLDGAHNASGAAALAAALEDRRDWRIILGLLGPKDPRAVIAPLLPHAAEIIFTRPRSTRGIPPEELARGVEGAEARPDLGAALALAKERSGGAILIAGSLYLVGEARALLLGQPVDPLPTADPIASR